MGEAPTIASMANGQSEKQKRGHLRGTEGAKNSPFCVVYGAPFGDPDDHLSASCVAVASGSQALSGSETGSSNPAVQLCTREVDELTKFGFSRWCLPQGQEAT